MSRSRGRAGGTAAIRRQCRERWRSASRRGRAGWWRAGMPRPVARRRGATGSIGRSHRAAHRAARSRIAWQRLVEAHLAAFGFDVLDRGVGWHRHRRGIDRQEPQRDEQQDGDGQQDRDRDQRAPEQQEQDCHCEETKPTKQSPSRRWRSLRRSAPRNDRDILTSSAWSAPAPSRWHTWSPPGSSAAPVSARFAAAGSSHRSPSPRGRSPSSRRSACRCRRR